MCFYKLIFKSAANNTENQLLFNLMASRRNLSAILIPISQSFHSLSAFLKIPITWLSLLTCFFFILFCYESKETKKLIPVCQKRGRQHGCQSLLICEGFASSPHATQRTYSSWRFQPVHSIRKKDKNSLYSTIYQNRVRNGVRSLKLVRKCKVSLH